MTQGLVTPTSKKKSILLSFELAFQYRNFLTAESALTAFQNFFPTIKAPPLFLVQMILARVIKRNNYYVIT